MPSALPTKNIGDVLEARRTKEALRKHQQGKGRPIISTEFAGNRVVAVGNTLYLGKGQKTFVDFLGNYIRKVLGERWGNAEIKKPIQERHQLLQWYDALCEYQKEHVLRPDDEIHESPQNGLTSAYYGLAYNLYLLQHNAELQAYLIRRLKKTDSFHAAYYETFVAAWFILAGFELTIENEQDPTTTHAEFVATRNGRRYSVEAKTRAPNKTNYDVGNQLYKALRVDTELPRFVFIDMNVEKEVNPGQFTTEVMKAVQGRESTLTIHGDPAPPAYVFITNEPHHLRLDDEHVARLLLATGFKIADFGHDVIFYSFIEVHRARERHSDALAVADAFKDYQIPTTFDGELPQFAFGGAARRFQIGQSYEIQKGVFATLTTGHVVEGEQKDYLGFHTHDDKAMVLSAELSDEELAAYRAHPETFFGRVIEQGRRTEDPMELFDFFLKGYRETPKTKLLEFMKDAPDIVQLEILPEEELRLVYAERLTLSVISRDGG